jgi:beta-aspartyl-dipeptidase (metallo-type)
MATMLTLLENGEVYAPEPLGSVPVLVSKGSILKVGGLDKYALLSSGLDIEVIDASGCFILPGFVDPHQHLLGGSGESGFSSQTPEISATEIATAGITTAVGCLGVDTTMKTLAGLLAKTKALKEEGLNAYMWSGGYTVPPTTITRSVRDDIMFIDEVIGAGEIAISDQRSNEPTALDIARIAHDAYVGGRLSNKAGVVHFHVGEGESRLAILRELVDKHDIPAEWLYPTHINRTDELMLEAIDLARRGSFVDIDTADQDLPEKLTFYFENKGPENKLTVSSDASISSPANPYDQFRRCVLEEKMPMTRILPLFTANTAAALRLEHKGTITEGKAADVLVVTKKDLEIREVISLGVRLVKNGSIAFEENFLNESNRVIDLEGKKANVRSNGHRELTQVSA